VYPEIAALQEILARGVDRGEIRAGHPALEFVPAMMFGVLRVRPVLYGEYADSDYLSRFVEAVVLPALGLAEGPPGDER
jgi:Tetracyclin repressor-like, C-terminal domain